MEKLEAVEEVHAMLNAVEKRAGELGVPSIVLIGLLQHVATVQSVTLHARIMQTRKPTVAEQIMAGRAPNV